MPQCKKCQNEFIIDERDKKFYEQIEVPQPTFCPDCRQQRRLAWINEMTLYQRQCDLSGENIISMYREDVPFPVYSPKSWWSDKWDGLSYGQDYDSNRSFFEQIKELKNKVPHIALSVTYATLVNSEYINYAAYTKNCYLIFDSDQDEDCYYCCTVNRCRDVVDCLKSQKLEFSYNCIDCMDCFKLQYCQDCQKCSESYFLKYCAGCNNCFGCVNLRNRSYCWFNEQLSEGEYQKRLAELDLGDRQVIRQLEKRVYEFSLKYPHIALHGIRNETCTGDYLYNTYQVFDCYDGWDLQNCRYCYSMSLDTKDAYDIFQFGSDCQLLYEGVIIGHKGLNVKFGIQCINGCRDVDYGIECINCRNCFGCVGLKKQEFCILNKQYNEKEYFELKKKIINQIRKNGEYGEFFPVSMSPYGYNETSAMFYFPLTKEEVLKQGFNWYDKEKEAVEKKSPPDNIKEVDDNITKEAFTCSCGKPFKIIPQELKFYQKLNIPLPDKCYICRHVERLKKRNPQHLWPRKCDKCGKEIKTTYSPERKEIVYCKACFQKEVY